MVILYQSGNGCMSPFALNKTDLVQDPLFKLRLMHNLCTLNDKRRINFDKSGRKLKLMI